MRPPDFLRGVVVDLGRDRVRLGLTIAGIAVGSFAVAALVSLGAAIEQAIAGSLRNLGENLVIVTPEPPHAGPLGARAAGTALGEDDARALRTLSTVEAASGVVMTRCLAGSGAEAAGTTCLGVDGTYLDVVDLRLADGAPLSATDDRAARAVAVVGATVARRLWPEGAVPGRSLELAGRPVRVVGLARPRGAGVGGVDEDDFVLVPKAFARRQLAARPDPGAVDAIFALARADGGVDAAVEDIADELARRRHVADIGDSLSVTALSRLMATSRQASSLLTLLMTGMAALSMLVGGVGIVNVMLTHLAERRLEIGLKLALGAAPRLIALEFLAAAVALGLAGGLAGLLAAQALAGLVGAAGFLSFSLTAPAVALALGLSLLVGVLAGAWPADRATRLEPREILRDA